MKKITTILIFFLCLYELSAQTDTRSVRVTAVKDTSVFHGNIYAVIVGISNYKYVKPLSFADQDALLFKDFLQSKAGGNVKSDNIFLILNQDANASTQPRIRKWLAETKKIQKGDRVYFYFAGHGDAINPDEYFFLLQDCNPGGDKNNYTGGMASVIQMYNIKSLIKNDLVNNGIGVVLIWDACRTNELPGGETGLKNLQTGIAEETDGESIMLSASAGEVALENSTYAHGHGLFTYYLIDGLSGAADNPANDGNGDGKVDMRELDDWVKRKVRVDAKTKFNMDQDPKFIYNGDETLSIVDSSFESEWAMKKMSGNDLALNYPKTVKGSGRNVEEADSLIVELYNKLMAAVKVDSLDDGQNSAEEWYKQLSVKYPYNSLTDQAGFNLAMEYINLAQDKINLYLSGEDDLTLLATPKTSNENHKILNQALTLSYGKNYGKNAQYLYRALELLKKDTLSDVNYMKQLEAKADFLSARSYVSNEGIVTDLSKALQLAKTAMELQPQGAYNYQLFGSLFYITKQYDSAVYYDRIALALAPRWVNALNNLGGTFEAEKKYDSAQFYYRKAIAINPDFLIPYANLSFDFSSRQLYDSAYKYSREAVALNPLYPGGYNALGIIFDFQKMYDSAKIYYYKTIRIDPKYTSAYNNLAILFYEQKQYDSSKNYYHKTISIDPNYTDAYYGLAIVFYEQKQYDSAKVYYAKTISIDPKYTDAYDGLGIVFMNLEQSDSSAIYYHKALSIDPKSTYANYNLAVLLNNSQQYDSAMYYYRKSISADPGYEYAYNGLGNVFVTEKKYDSAKIYFNKAINIDRKFTDAAYNLGYVFSTQNENDSAKSYYYKALTIDPIYTKAYNGLGNICIIDKKFDSAAIYFHKSIKIDPKFTDAVYNLGFLFIIQNQIDSAKNYYHKALTIDPKYIKAYDGLGNVFAIEKKYDSAAIYFHKAISIDRKFTDTYSYLGFLFYSQKQYDSAKIYYHQALTIDPEYRNAYNSLGNIFLIDKKYDSARIYFHKAINIDPKFTDAVYNLGRLCFIQNQMDSAKIFYLKTLKIDPKYTKAYDGLGNIFVIDKKYDSAAIYFRNAISIDPKFTDAYYNVGFIFYTQKRYDSSKYFFYKSISIDPEYANGYNGLGNIFFQQQLYDSAILNFRAVIKFDSLNVTANNYLSACLLIEHNNDSSAYFLKKLIKNKAANGFTFTVGVYILSSYENKKMYDKELEIARLLYNYDSVYEIPEVDSTYKKNLLYSLAFSYLFTGNSAAAKYYYEKVGELSYYYYNVACMASLDNKIKDALENLELSFQKGYKDYDHLQKDTDLDNIRNTREFKQLLKKYYPDKPGN